jgi:hypothetical protein
MAEAHFSRTDTAEGARFDVTPAPALKTRSALIGCGAIFAIGLGLAALTAGIGVFLLSAILWVPLLIAAYLAKKTGDKYSRAPTTLIVSAGGIRAGDRHFAATDIAELLLQLPYDHGGVHRESAPRTTGAQVGTMVAQAQENRSYALMARLKSDSRPQVLVFGLTYNVGSALLSDVSGALQGH